jgi:hypothetical protein
LNGELTGKKKIIINYHMSKDCIPKPLENPEYRTVFSADLE